MKWQSLLTVGAALALVATSNGQTTNAISNIACFNRLTLSEGRNFVALPVIPATSTLTSVVGTNLPANTTESSASVIDFWEQSSQTLTNRSWLSSSATFPGWRAAATFADHGALQLDVSKGFVVTVRAGQGSQGLLLAGFVAINVQSQVVQNNGDTLTGSTYPVPVALADSGLVASGFVGGSSLATSDTLRFFNPATQLFDQTIWHDSATSTWRNSDGSVATRQLIPGEAFVIRRGNWAAGSFTWTNPIPAVLSQELP